MTQLVEQQWFKDAACANSDPEPFHPGKRTRKRDIAAAKELCGICPVAQLCLATFFREEWGIWGGLDEQERRYLRKQQRLA